MNKRGELTLWTRQEVPVRTRRESNRARGTHKLETVEGGTHHGKIATERGALTDWRWQRERLLRTRSESHIARDTHFLEVAEEGTYQDTERE